MQYVVTGSSDGDVKYFTVIDDGKIVENQLGEDPNAEFTLSSTYDDSVRVLKGELDANAAFMQGKMKVAGNMGKLMSPTCSKVARAKQQMWLCCSKPFPV